MDSVGDAVLCISESGVLSRKNQLISGELSKMQRNVLLCFSE